MRAALTLVSRVLSAGCAIQYLWWFGKMVGSWMGWTEWPHPNEVWFALAFGYAFLCTSETAFPALRTFRMEHQR